MAVNNLLSFNLENDSMAMPLSMQRGNPNPLDSTDLYSSYEDALDYAHNSPVAYVGQVIGTVIESTNDDGETEYDVHLYQIMDADGTLLEIGSGIDSVFDDARFQSIQTAVDTLTGDEDTEGSLNHAIKQGKVKIEKETATTANIYHFYQGIEEAVDHYVKTEDGATITVDEYDALPTDEKAAYEPVIVERDALLGSIQIDKDVFIDTTTVVEVTEVTDPDTGDVSLIDSEGDVPPAAVTKTGLYLKMKMSNGDMIYIAASDLTVGLIRKVKLGAFEYNANADGVVDIENVPIDLLYQGDTMLILNGGDSTI